VPRTRWTPELIDRVRKMAAEGYSAAQAADQLMSNLGTLCKVAAANGISFKRLAMSQRPCRAPLRVLDMIVDPDQRVRVAAKIALRDEIAKAKAEAATAPLYRGGWPD
jgi:hypothetical protein